MEGFKFSTIEEAVADLRAGKMIIAVDDPDRENEGDLICAAEHATLENVNFMASYAKGLICMPMSKALTTKLGLEQYRQSLYGIYRFDRPCGYDNRYFGVGTFHDGHEERRGRCQTVRFPASGAYVSFGGESRRGTRTYGTYRSYRRSDAYCPAQGMWLVL